MTDVWRDLRLTVESRWCGCGDNVLRVYVVDSQRELRCETCNSRAGLFSARSADFVLAVCRGFGASDTPIILRRPQIPNSA
jgi:hypothetical protein